MPIFRFYLDTKTSMWDRDEYVIERETEEEAIEFMKKVFNKQVPNEDMPQPVDSQPLDDTISYEEPTICSPSATRELLFIVPAGEDIHTTDNAIPPIQNPHV